VAVFQRSRVEQIGTPTGGRQEPNSAFVVEFLGLVHGLPGTVRGDRLAMASLRTHDLDLRATDDPALGVAAAVEQIACIGPRLRIGLSTSAGELLQAEVDREGWQSEGRRIGDRVRVVPRHVRMFHRTS
jgi:ABC-type sulfate/molybdate transport systems ATPase subunit